MSLRDFFYEEMFGFFHSFLTMEKKVAIRCQSEKKMRKSLPVMSQICKSDFHGNKRLTTFRVSFVPASTGSSHTQGVTLVDFIFFVYHCGSGFIALEKNGKDRMQSA